MNSEFESLDSVLYDFNDIETPPDLTVRPAHTALVVRVFRERLISEEALARRQDVAELEQGAREGHEECLRSKNIRGAVFCLGNLALILNQRGDRDGALKVADQAHRLACDSGLTELAANMRATREQLQRENKNGA